MPKLLHQLLLYVKNNKFQWTTRTKRFDNSSHGAQTGFSISAVFSFHFTSPTLFLHHLQNFFALIFEENWKSLNWVFHLLNKWAISAISSVSWVRLQTFIFTGTSTEKYRHNLLRLPWRSTSPCWWRWTWVFFIARQFLNGFFLVSTFQRL